MNDPDMHSHQLDSTTEPASPATATGETKGEFRPLVIVGIILLASFGISRWAVWYGDEISIPRYCSEPQAAIESLRSVLSDDAAKDRQGRRTAMVAAKIMFLIPRESGESVDDYLGRATLELGYRCQ